jgi:hypothetical protein
VCTRARPARGAIRGLGVIALLVALLLATGCGGSQPRPSTTASSPSTGKNAAVPDELAINYRASGGRPSVDARLVVPPSGDAVAFLGTTWSVPSTDLVVAGEFRGPLSSSWRERMAAALKPLVRTPGPTPLLDPHSPARSLTVTTGGDQVEVNLGQGDPSDPASKVEPLVLEAIQALRAHPVRAVTVTTTAKVTDGRVVPTLTFTNPGTEALPIVLWDPGNVGGFFRTNVLVAQPGVDSNPVPTTGEYVKELVDAGSVPSGASELVPGTSLSVVLPSQPVTAEEGVQVQVTVAFVAVIDGDHRSIILQLPVVPAS